jgi:hypothetical protein
MHARGSSQLQRRNLRSIELLADVGLHDGNSRRGRHKSSLMMPSAKSH